MTVAVRFFVAYRPISLCQLVSLATVFFLLGWLTSKSIFWPMVAYVDYVTPSPVTSCINRRATLADKNAKNSENSNSAASSSHSHSSSSSVKLVCMVLTAPNTTQTKAIEGVKATWGRRCDKLVFISSQRDDSVPTIPCNCTEGYNFLWGKVKSGFIYVHKNFNNEGSEYNWFLKADDDTYVIMENLKAQLKRHDPNKPFALGRRINAYLSEGYLAGGSGYVLSKAALKSLVETGLLTDFDKTCRRKRERGIEDVEMGMCLHALSISIVDTRDPDDNLETFIPHDPEESLTTRHNRSTFWLHSYNYYKTFDDGQTCCSDRPASFHRLNASMMRVLEYFAYRFKLITQ